MGENGLCVERERERENGQEKGKKKGEDDLLFNPAVGTTIINILGTMSIQEIGLIQFTFDTRRNQMMGCSFFNKL